MADVQDKLKDIHQIEAVLRNIKPSLLRSFGVKEIGVFGSYVRGTQNADSDVDVLVDIDRGIGLIEFVKLEKAIAKALALKVDLVMKGSLKRRIGRRVMDEVVMI